MTATEQPGPAPADVVRASAATSARSARWLSDRTGYLAAAWAGLSGVLAMIWTLLGRGYPFGGNDPQGEASLLRLVPVSVGAPLFAGVLLTSAVLALAIADRHAIQPVRWARMPLLTYGWLVSFALLVIVPDARVLIVLGYLPILLVGAPFGWPPVDYSTMFDWSLANKLSAVLGGLLLARALLVWQFRTAGGCAACGRRAGSANWTSAAAAARWGRWAVWVAVVVPMLYAATRFAWLAGIPLGIPRSFLREMQQSGLVYGGAALAALAVGGAILTVGLVRPWGEVFPRWLPGLAGRPVPVPVAVVPALVVAVAVAAASLGMVTHPRFWDLGGGHSSATLPMLLWPLWAAALAAAATAYYLRRRGTCPHCGRVG